MTTPQSLMRTTAAIFVLALVAFLFVLFMANDAKATRTCVEKGYSEEYCGWR